MSNSDWQSAALGKFFRLDSEARGLNAAVGASTGRINDLIASRRAEEAALVEFKLHRGQTTGDTAIIDRRIAAFDTEITRINAALEPALRGRDVQSKKLEAAAIISSRCGALLVRLGVLNQGEI